MPPAVLFIRSKMDGRRSPSEIQAACMMKFGRLPYSDGLDALTHQSDECLFLDSPRREAHLARLEREYRSASYRRFRGLDGSPSAAARLEALLDEVPGTRPVDAVGEMPPREADGPLIGLIAPHLHHERGRPCHSAAYGGLARRTDARRFVILGTNHFDHSAGVVGTRKDFETPWGIVPHDAAFMAALDDRCGADLCAGEYNHVNEHSVELQVAVLRRALGDRPFTIAPYLCPDPCGPTGTAPPDGRDVDLRGFAEALRALVDAGSVPTCVIAGADLSHAGQSLHDERALTEENFSAVAASDRFLPGCVLDDRPESLRRRVARTRDDTNICSVGCMYALAWALKGRGRRRLVHYHQAVTAEAENCVTCAAVEIVE